MKKIRISILTLIFIVNAIINTSCWNYKEIDKLAIVAGAAVDKGTNDQFSVTAEIIKISGGKDTKPTSKTITMEGKTMFDAVRNGISLTGDRLYWSHSKVLILSKEIASEGITKVLDWYTRDSETREDVNILISEEATAKEIFAGQGTIEEIKSIVLSEMIKNQDSLSKAPKTDILQLSIEFQTKGISSVIPTISLKKSDVKVVPQIIGSAIIKDKKLVGFLNGEETKDLQLIRDEVKGGVLVEGMDGNGISVPVSLEIISSKTKVKPVVDGNNIEINLDIDTTVAIDEIEGTENYIDEDGRKYLEQSAEKKLKERIESLIRKIQTEYDADIFRFGSKFWEDEAKVWKSISNNWDGIFKNLKVNVTTKVHIKNSAILSSPIKEGD